MLQSYALGAKNVRINVVSCKQDGKKSESVLSIREKNTLKDNIVDIFGPKQCQSMVDIGSVPIQGRYCFIKKPEELWEVIEINFVCLVEFF